MNLDKIITSHDKPPIPIRKYDWSARREEYDEGDPVGFGATEQEAIQDLIAKDGKFDYEKISNVEVNGVDRKDHPNYCDAHILSADYDDTPMSDEMIDKLNENSSYVHDCVLEKV